MTGGGLKLHFVFVQMHIPLWEGDVDAAGVKGLFDVFGGVHIHVPVVIALHPGAYHKVDAAVAQLSHGDLKGRVFQDTVVLAQDPLDDLPGLRVLDRVEGQGG